MNCAVNLGFHEYTDLHPKKEDELIKFVEWATEEHINYYAVKDLLDYKICKKCGFKTPRYNYLTEIKGE